MYRIRLFTETRTKLALLLLLVECLLSPKLTRREEGIFSSPPQPIVLSPVCPSFSGNKISHWAGALPINFAKLKSNYRARGIPARFERIRDKGPRREGESFHPDRIRLGREGRSPWNRVKGISIPRVWGSETNGSRTARDKNDRIEFLKLKRNGTRYIYLCNTLFKRDLLRMIVSLVHSRSFF